MALIKRNLFIQIIKKMILSLLDFTMKKISSLFIKKSRRWDSESPLHDLDLWALEKSRTGNIAVCGMDTLDLIKTFGSPLLVINEPKLIHDAKMIQDALTTTAPSDSLILYSYKTNCIPVILEKIHALGIGAEVISPYELWLAEKLKVPGDRIIYNGVNKTRESIERAIRMGVIAINVDHSEEVERIYQVAKGMNKKIRVGIRLALVSKSQFGLEVESGEASYVCKKIMGFSDYLELVCIHFNVVSNAKLSIVHKSCAHMALKFMHQLKIETGAKIEYLDIGGGFGVPTTKKMSGKEYGLYRLFGCLPKPPSPNDLQSIESFLAEIISSIKADCREFDLEIPKILIEPGRYITSRCEFLLVTVLTVKKRQNGTNFAMCDAGRLSLTFPCDFEFHEVFLANGFNKKRDKLYNVMGRICTSADWMFKNKYLPELKPGDTLAVMDAGAYFSSYSTNFAFPRPAIVMIAGGKATLIRRAETFEHLTAMDVFESFKPNNQG